MSNLSVETLIQKREQLMADLEALQTKYGNEILEINRAIVAITGKTIHEVEAGYRYDDETPSAITGTEDGI